MSLAIIEINDCGLHCSTQHNNEQGQSFVSPGYALLTAQGVTTGQAALEQAYLHPQQSHNQYWRQLNLSPLPSPNSHARHHADLAYAQLLQLHQDSGSPDEVIFATPGSFDREQLSIILGLANAAPFKTVSLVDSAVAAASQSDITTNNLIHLDIQLHQWVVTRLTINNDVIERTGIDIITDSGLQSFYDIWARYIADQFIQQYRYDPLHTAEGEQQLYDSLPLWLAQVNGDQEIAISLDSPQGSYKLNLNRNDLLASSQSKVEQLQQKLSSFTNDNDSSNNTLIASHRTLLLPNLTTQLGIEKTLPANATMMGCMANMETIVNRSEDIHFVTKLPIFQNHSANTSTHINKDPEANKTAAPEQPENNPTHVLYQHMARAIGNTLYIHQEEQSLNFSHEQPSDTKFFVENGQIYFQSEQGNLNPPESSTPLQIGETVTIGPHSLQLIEVACD